MMTSLSQLANFVNDYVMTILMTTFSTVVEHGKSPDHA